MINAPIGGPDILQIQNISPAVQKQGIDTGNDFKQAFESAKDTVSEASESTKVNRTEGTGAGGKDSGTADQTVDNSKAKQNNAKETSTDRKDNVKDDADIKDTIKAETADSSVNEDVAEIEEVVFDTAEISKITEKMILDIAALLGISPEELGTVLDNMGIEASDLMVSENINILVADVKGGGDMISLAADASLMELAADINTLVADVQEKIEAIYADIPEETVKEVVRESFEAIVTTEETALVQTDKNATVGNVTDKLNVSVADNETVIAAGDMVVEKVEAVENTGNKENTGNNAGTEKNEDRHTAFEHTEHREALNFTRVEVTPEMEVRPEDVVKADESLMRYGSNAAEVADQILEHMKAQVKPDMGSLEMVLHPASLGSVAVNLASNSGNITAQFTVQNEAVREAIEAQIVIFKENLEQQGVKVEAVEVAVASHGFEENLEQGNDQNDAEDAERERLRKANRNIDLGAFGDEVPEDIDEAESVTVDMMRSDGNRMNYRV